MDAFILELQHRMEALEDQFRAHCAEGTAHMHEHDIEDSAIDVSGAVEEHLNRAAAEVEAALEAEKETQPPASEPEEQAPPAPPPEPPREEIEPKREHLLHRRIG
jgi:outer membrane biosynthesis protein TonB